MFREVWVTCSIWSTLVPERSTRNSRHAQSEYLYGYSRAPLWGYRGVVKSPEIDPWTRALSQTLKAERAAAGLSLDELAARSGLSRSTVVRLDSGARSIRTDQLAFICAALGLRMSEFIRRAEERMVTNGVG